MPRLSAVGISGLQAGEDVKWCLRVSQHCANGIRVYKRRELISTGNALDIGVCLFIF